MPQQIAQSVESNFTKGLITESTGLNFPENAATDANNCMFTVIGETKRRLGIDYEDNFATDLLIRDRAQSTYVWKNVGGDGNTQFLAAQLGDDLHFYDITASTASSPLSAHIFPTHVRVDSFVAPGGTFDTSLECQYADGNGYLIVYHPSCDPFWVSYDGSNFISAKIDLKIRDFVGDVDGYNVNDRPNALTNPHLYNLTNQGWTSGAPWTSGSSSSVTVGTGSRTFTVNSGMSVNLGDLVNIITNIGLGPGVSSGSIAMSGNVTAYSGTTMTVNVTGTLAAANGTTGNNWTLTAFNKGYLNTWNSAVGNYPSNADVWWYFKDSSNVFNPAVTINQVTLGVGPAPKGHFLLPAFNLDRSLVSAVSDITAVSTVKRPRTGCWFQGRAWFTGVDAAQAASSTTSYYTWTENIYFSQVVITPDDLGKCYQTNDPTSETLFDLLPTDGGVINIQGSGSIFKLFPVANGLIVFAANGVWFITGSQGIGFTANDYTITKISNVPSISSTSFVDVLGLPYFWNEDGIYNVQQQQGGSLSVTPITVGTIETLYDAIPLSSKKYVRGAYHPIDYVIQWIYKDTEATDINDRYAFNKILNYNAYTKAFYPYTAANDNTSINGINYIAGPGGSDTPKPCFKYWCSTVFSGNTFSATFADEHDETYVDWASTVPSNYQSYFTTGYKLRGGAIKKFQTQYLHIFNKTGGDPFGYNVQGIWDYTLDKNSGRWSSPEHVVRNSSRSDVVFKRHKIRGRGYVLQIKVFSVDGMPFRIIGWSIIDTVNTGA